jgi:hypothetical protein
MNAPINNEIVTMVIRSDVLAVINAAIQKDNEGAVTRAVSTPGDIESVVRLTMAYQVLEARFPGHWLLVPNGYGVCLQTASWSDD